MTHLFVIVGVVALIPVISVLRGWVISIIWNWFMVPLFHVPSLSIAQGLAVSLMVGLLTFEGGKEERQSSEIWATAFFAPLFTLGMAWVLRLFL